MDFINTRSAVHWGSASAVVFSGRATVNHQLPAPPPPPPLQPSHPPFGILSSYRIPVLDKKHHFQWSFFGSRSEPRRLWQLKQRWRNYWDPLVKVAIHQWNKTSLNKKSYTVHRRLNGLCVRKIRLVTLGCLAAKCKIVMNLKIPVLSWAVGGKSCSNIKAPWSGCRGIMGCSIRVVFEILTGLCVIFCFCAHSCSGFCVCHLCMYCIFM